MDYSSMEVWNFIIQTGIIAILVIVSTVLRHIPFIKKTLIPTSVLAGFLLLGFKYLHIIEVNQTFLEVVTYHGIALGFIALSLRVSKEQKDNGKVGTAVRSGALIVSTYLVQAITGLIISLLLAYTFMPGLFKASGMLLPMGYGQGPGQANNIGTTYEKLGFAGGHSYGLAIAAAGFLCACIVGVIYLNVQAKRGKIVRKSPEELSGSVSVDTFQDPNEIPISQSIDKLSIQMALILLVYIFTFGVIFGITTLLAKTAPGVANMLSPLLWGFNFIFASLFALLLKVIMKGLKKGKLMKRQYANNYLLNRISGFFFDVMIICGIAAIDFSDLKGLWIPFAITVIAGGIVTFVYLKFITKKLYGQYAEEAFLSMFGMLTGTISSGILLVREIDPEFQTPAANNLVSGSGTGIVFGAPMLILVGMAAKSTMMTFVVMGIVVVYLCVLLLIILLRKKETVNSDTVAVESSGSES
ncbi:MAG: sodium:glutamate symporter [Treponema sp.]|nr:sodium:glutamate symporter [Treponema sp.]